MGLGEADLLLGGDGAGFNFLEELFGGFLVSFGDSDTVGVLDGVVRRLGGPGETLVFWFITRSRHLEERAL